MVANLLIPVIVLVQLSLTGGHAVPSGATSRVPPHSFLMDTTTEAARGDGWRRATASGRHWELDKNEEHVGKEQEEEEEGEGSENRESAIVFGEQKRFMRPAEEEQREKFALLRERNMREQERRRQQRMLTQSQKEYRPARHRVKCSEDSSAHMVHLLLQIHNSKMRRQMAGDWLRDCVDKKIGPVQTSIRYFG